MDLNKYTYLQYIYLYLTNPTYTSYIRGYKQKNPLENLSIKPNPDCIHHPPTNLGPNRRPLGSKPIGKG